MAGRKVKLPELPTVLVIEDHPLVSQGLVALFGVGQNSIELLVEQSLETGTKRVQDQFTVRPIDLVLLDLGLPGHSGISAFWSFREQCPDTPVAVFSGMNDPVLMAKLLRGGASGFIPKTLHPDVVVGAVQLILSGGTFIPLETLREDSIVDLSPQGQTDHQKYSSDVGAGTDLVRLASQRQQAEVEIDALTTLIVGMPRRRREILHLIAEGRSNKEICRVLGVTMNTVKTHITLIFHSLTVKSRHELLILLHHHNLLPSTVNQVIEPPSDLSATSEAPLGARRPSVWPLQ